MEQEIREYQITLTGCDDETRMRMELSSAEAELIERICYLSEETSTYSCMPTMSIHEVAKLAEGDQID